MLVEVMDKIVEIFRMNAKHPSRTHQALLQKFVFFSELVLKGGCVLYILAGGFYFLEPIYSFVFKNKLIPLIPLFFPMIDENTIDGYIILMAIHVLFIILAVIGSAATDFMFIMIIANIPVLTNILANDVQEINNILREEEIDMVQVKGRFRNILYMHRELLEYVF